MSADAARRLLDTEKPAPAGLCRDCAPEDHGLYNQALALIGDAERDFEAETGLRALEKWYRFEKFLLGWPRAGELAAVLAQRGAPC